MEYAFCETVHAGPVSRWHIRQLSEKGLCSGGGADTLALCGRQVAWDLARVPITLHHLTVNACPKCRTAYRGPVEE